LLELDSQILAGCHPATRSDEHFHRSGQDPSHGVGCTLPYVGAVLVKLINTLTPARLRLSFGEIFDVLSVEKRVWPLLMIGERLDLSTRSCAKQG
jgi:hypothetical protein